MQHLTLAIAPGWRPLVTIGLARPTPETLLELWEIKPAEERELDAVTALDALRQGEIDALIQRRYGSVIAPFSSLSAWSKVAMSNGRQLRGLQDLSA